MASKAEHAKQNEGEHAKQSKAEHASKAKQSREHGKQGKARQSEASRVLASGAKVRHKQPQGSAG
jgi:hypothetical protein